jgi:thioredoxin reductase (NADPH)
MTTEANRKTTTNGNKREVHDIIIIGSGPAGLSTALYAARAHRKPLVITGNELGGQVSITNEVENYPGFPEGLTGPELVDRMQKHAERFGAQVQIDYISEVDFSRRPFRLTGYNGDYFAKAVIIASGARPRLLEISGETKLTGRGVSYCGTCDGYFFQGKEIVVVGGGDSALEEGVFLTKYATKVTIIHRRDQFRAGATLQARARKNDKIDVIWDTIVTEIIGDEAVRAVRLKNLKTGQEWERPIDGVFIFIGHIPNNDLYEGQLEFDELGYLVVDREMRSSVEGIWVAGEAADPIFRQVVTSAGTGAAAAMAADRWLSEHEDDSDAEPQPSATVEAVA